jgi:predicted GIY-YIG superfamily endonuclease
MAERSEDIISEPTQMNEKEWIVYCLATCYEPIATYVGATVDRDRRLKQHNAGREAGGAKRTAARPGEWYRLCFVSGFASKHEALSFEWHWKHFSKKVKGDPLTRRQKGLETCLLWAASKFSASLQVEYDE